jgi:hypothetical protein
MNKESTFLRQKKIEGFLSIQVQHKSKTWCHLEKMKHPKTPRMNSHFGNQDFVGLACSKHDLEDEITFKSN